MKIATHISFYFSQDRIKYINKIIDETNNYEMTTDIFIHTNDSSLQDTSFNAYTNGCLKIVWHDLTNINPFYLTWKCRDLLRQQKDDYDIFMYIEDDMLVPYKAIKYWLKYNEKMIEMNCNVGFVRIEVEDNIEYITDLQCKLDCLTILDNAYCVNDKNAYCAFWIYNKTEFNKFVNSEYYDINNIKNYEIREASAIGLHGSKTHWYKYTLIPIINNKCIEDCKIYHMQNNYVADKSSWCATIKFDEAINPACKLLT